MSSLTVSQGSSLQLIYPGTGGVLDYAAKIAGAIQAPVVEYSQDTDTSSWSGDLLLLHYSNYGYQKRGIPTWMPGHVQALRKRFKVLGVVFHELYAFGPPWRSEFWLSGVQRRIARETLRQADFWLTNREEAGRWLRKSSGSTVAPHRVVPVFSNMGEPAVADLATPRQPTMIVFGGGPARARTYRWNDGEIHVFAKRHGLRIHDIGPPLPDEAMTRRLIQEGAVVHGLLSEQLVSLAMRSARFGVVEYPTIDTAKSGIFAAYAAHKMCPILLCRDYDVHDGLRGGINYAAGFEALNALNASDLTAQLARIGCAARQWYESHRIDAHVDALQTLSSEARP